MSEVMEKWVTEVHRKKGFPKQPHWHVQAEHYIRAFVSDVRKREKEIKGAGVANPGVWKTSMAFDTLVLELLGRK